LSNKVGGVEVEGLGFDALCTEEPTNSQGVVSEGENALFCCSLGLALGDDHPDRDHHSQEFEEVVCGAIAVKWGSSWDLQSPDFAPPSETPKSEGVGVGDADSGWTAKAQKIHRDPSPYML
jgi:hypothetical protein